MARRLGHAYEAPMPVPPFHSLADFLASRGDLARWRPWVSEVLDRHGLGTVGELQAGVNPTNPTFVADTVVVKFFGMAPFWERSHRAEQAALAALVADRTLRVPQLLAEGSLGRGTEPAWPYLVTERVSGLPWSEGLLTDGQRHRIATELGEQLRRVHALPASDLLTPDDWGPGPVPEALARGRFPARWLREVEPFLATLPPDEPGAMVHADLVSHHVFVADGHLAAIIDWGDAVRADRHLEIGKLHVDVFEGDRALLRSFLEGYGWQPDPDFAQRVLGHALRRQALGQAQHHGFDLFHRLHDQVDVPSLTGLPDLAPALFGHHGARVPSR